MSVTVEIPGKPISCPRPRVTRFGTYYTDAYSEWKEIAGRLIRDAVVRQNGGRLLEGPLKATLLFVGAHGASDIDNLCKSVLDAAQGQAFENDKQVDMLVASKRKGKPARTEVTLEIV